MRKLAMVFTALLKPWTRWGVRRVFESRWRSHSMPNVMCLRARVNDLSSDTWTTFWALVTQQPGRLTMPAFVDLHLACLRLAFFRALLRHGVERGAAIDLTRELQSNFCSRWYAIARLLSPERHVAQGEVVSPAFPFEPAGYPRCPDIVQAIDSDEVRPHHKRLDGARPTPELKL